MKSFDLNKLENKSKKEVLQYLGEEFNFYPDKLWYYVLSENWWGKKKVLFLEFDERDKVSAKYIKTIFGKVKKKQIGFVKINN